jgi:hypothetical protein
MGNLSEIDEDGTDVAEVETDTNSSKDRKEEETQQEDETPENILEAKDPVDDEKTNYGQKAEYPKKEKITQVTNLYEEQMKDEHEIKMIKMRILIKKEQLLDLQIAFAKEELSQINE